MVSDAALPRSGVGWFDEAFVANLSYCVCTSCFQFLLKCFLMSSTPAVYGGPAATEEEVDETSFVFLYLSICIYI